MIDFISRVWNQFVEFFTGLSPGRRIALFGTLGVVVVGLTMILMWAGGTDYQVLASNLVSEDSTAVMRLLREKKIPFKVDNDGKTIKIPPDAIYDLRLEIAAMGMSQANIVGYEVFDKQGFGTTSFVQKVNQKRALEGELMRTVNALKGVKRSRIHLAIPTTSTFKEDQKHATASVVIDFEPGVKLNDKQLAGIQHLVSSAIEGMETNDVIVMESSGKILSRNNSDPLAQRTATMLEFQQKFEQEQEKKIEDILNRVVGEGKIVAKVAMDMDFTQSVESSTQYDQEGATVSAEQKDNTSLEGSRPLPMGAPGAASNTPGPASVTSNPAVTTNNQKVFETKNWKIPEKTTRSTKAPYSVKRMSVAVLLDGMYQKDTTKGEGAPAVYQKWTEEKLAEFKAIVAQAVALDPKRGDTIEVKNMEFQKQDMVDAEQQILAFERKKMLQNIFQYAIIGLILAMFFLFVVRPFVKWLTENTIESMESFLPRTVEELEKLQTTDDNIATLEEAIPVIVDKVDPEKVEGEMIKEKVVTLIETSPEKAAMIIHEWINKPSKAQMAREAAAKAAM